MRIKQHSIPSLSQTDERVNRAKDNEREVFVKENDFKS